MLCSKSEQARYLLSFALLKIHISGPVQHQMFSLHPRAAVFVVFALRFFL